MIFKDIINPIPNAVRDPERISDFFWGNKIAPYSGNSTQTAHGRLKLLYDLANSSPSKNGVINFLCRYGFTGKLDLVESGIPGLSLNSDTDPISDKDKRSLAKAFSKGGFSFDQILRLSKRQVRDNNICGNIYTIYEEASLNQSKQVFLDYLHPREGFYQVPEKTRDPRYMYVFKFGWSPSNETDKKRWEKIGVYPNWTKTKNGRKTIFHLANLIDINDLYGRPNDPSTMLSQYVEYSNNDLSAKVSRKEIVTKYILAFQQEILDRTVINKDERAAKMRSITTSVRNGYVDEHGDFIGEEDESQTIACLDYTGTKAPTAIKLEIDRNHDWWDSQMLGHSNFIFMTNGIDKDLAGFERSKGSLNSQSGEYILQQFKKTDFSLIRPQQQEYAEYYNSIINEAAVFLGISDWEDLGIKFPGRINEMIEETLEINQRIDARSNSPKEEGGKVDIEAK